jgi:hypothetical protein
MCLVPVIVLAFCCGVCFSTQEEGDAIYGLFVNGDEGENEVVHTPREGAVVGLTPLGEQLGVGGSGVPVPTSPRSGTFSKDDEGKSEDDEGENEVVHTPGKRAVVDLRPLGERLRVGDSGVPVPTFPQPRTCDSYNRVSCGVVASYVRVMFRLYSDVQIRGIPIFNCLLKILDAQDWELVPAIRKKRIIAKFLQWLLGRKFAKGGIPQNDERGLQASRISHCANIESFLSLYAKGVKDGVFAKQEAVDVQKKEQGENGAPNMWETMERNRYAATLLLFGMDIARDFLWFLSPSLLKTGSVSVVDVSKAVLGAFKEFLRAEKF